MLKFFNNNELTICLSQTPRDPINGFQRALLINAHAHKGQNHIGA